MEVGVSFALALHSFEPASATCLSFRAGQIIKTLNKDGSGWWDGELGGKRGWFPSNYVEVYLGDETRVDEKEELRKQVVETSKRDSGRDGVVESIQHAISLLQCAVEANRIAHFQPSTACVISSVRQVLSLTSCLTRESPLLLQHPSLASSRKRILSSLAALVNQARRASSPTITDDERRSEKEIMLRMAENVWRGVMCFLNVAKDLDIEVSPSNITIARIPETEETNFLRTTKSTPTLVPSSSSSGSNNLTVSVSTSSNGSAPLITPAALSEHLTFLHDSLLSTIAAFIGHIHSHSRTSHSSSYSHLISMTRSTIAQVRSILVIVEAVLGGTMDLRGQEVLSITRERLHEATTKLVGAARIATTEEEISSNQESQERSRLLAAATGVLRAGGECIKAVKAVIARGGIGGLRVEGIELNTSEEEGNLLAIEPAPAAIRMERRAGSLDSLRSLAQSSAFALSPSHSPVSLMQQVEDSPNELDYGSFDSTSHVRMTSVSTSSGTSGTTFRVGNTTPVPPSSSVISSRPITHSRTSSRASSRAEGRSVPMSRGESSRTSESATSSRSALSGASTSATSPRSSMSIGGIDSIKIGESISSSSSSNRLSLSASSPNSPLLPLTPIPTSPGSTPHYLARTYSPATIAFNPAGELTGGTLPTLIERMTLHDSTIDPFEAKTFWLTFRIWSTPIIVAKLMCARFDLNPVEELDSIERSEWETQVRTPVRLRVYNFFKTWLEAFWDGERDREVLKELEVWSRTVLGPSGMVAAEIRLRDIIQRRLVESNNNLIENVKAKEKTKEGNGFGSRMRRMKSSEKLKAGKVVPFIDPYSSISSYSTSAPSPIISKSVAATIRASPTSYVGLLEIDPLELARQLTIMESRLYCGIRAEELVGSLDSGGSGAAPIEGESNLRAMSSGSTKLTGWIAETILNEQDAKKRTGLVKYFIKLAERCFGLSNYNALMAILCALQSSTISRLKRTWDGVPTKYLNSLDLLRKATEHSRNYAEYRSRIRDATTPCLPFVGLFLTDVTFCFEGNGKERISLVDKSIRLINFDRYAKMAKIVLDLQRFQVPYNLSEVPELQRFLTAAFNSTSKCNGKDGSASDLYRKSMSLEPRLVDDNLHNGGGGGEFGWIK